MNRSAVVALAVAVVASSAVIISALGADEWNGSPSHQDELIAQLEQLLAETADEAMRASLEEKLRMARETRQQELAARQRPPDAAALKAKQEQLLRESEAADSATKVHLPWLPAGDGYIVEEAMPPFPASLMVPENDWFRDTGKDSIQVVWAGADGQDRSQGMVLVMTESPAGFEMTGRFHAPGNAGALRVVGASGLVLRLLAADGTTLDFDAETLSFK